MIKQVIVLLFIQNTSKFLMMGGRGLGEWAQLQLTDADM